MRGVLTQTKKALGAVGLCLLAGWPGVGLCRETAAQPLLLPIPLSSSEMYSVREAGSPMTWKIQKLHFSDGLAVVTVAGVQFEEALGLSVVVLDSPPPLLTQTSTIAVHSGPLVDITRASEKRLPGEPPRAEIYIKNLLVDLNDITQPESTVRAALPECEAGGRRAVVFIRSAQLGRIFDLDAARATTLSQYGRAACLRWNGMPEQISDKH